MEVETKKCFVIMPIGDTVGYAKGHFTKVYRHLLKPAIEKAGYSPERADEVQSTSLIAADIIDRICNTPIAICDISSCNPNVFYELGIRHTCLLPVVLIKDKKTNNPFDIKDIRYIEYSENLEYDNVIEKQEEIKAAIIKTLEDFQHGVCRNSLIPLIRSDSSNNENQLCSDLSFLEKESEKISTLIDNSTVCDCWEIVPLIGRFKRMCHNYPGGITFAEYLKMKFLYKYPGEYYEIQLFLAEQQLL